VLEITKGHGVDVVYDPVGLVNGMRTKINIAAFCRIEADCFFLLLQIRLNELRGKGALSSLVLLRVLLRRFNSKV